MPETFDKSALASEDSHDCDNPSISCQKNHAIMMALTDRRILH